MHRDFKMTSESDDEEAAACEIAQGMSSARLKICHNCGELGHVKKSCLVLQVTDENRLLIESLRTISSRPCESLRKLKRSWLRALKWKRELTPTFKFKSYDFFTIFYNGLRR